VLEARGVAQALLEFDPDPKRCAICRYRAPVIGHPHLQLFARIGARHPDEGRTFAQGRRLPCFRLHEKGGKPSRSCPVPVHALREALHAYTPPPAIVRGP